jgi:Uncharacterized protein conserved in cyanobacteria
LEKDKRGPDRIKEQTVTYDIYAAMPDDGHRYEILDGSMEMMSPGPSTTHQAVSGVLEFILQQSCRSDYMVYHAPLDVILDQTNVVQPDVLMIHRSRLHIVTQRGIEGPPDMVTEILSPGSRRKDKVTKRRTYAKFGVREYWVVDTESLTLEQYRLDEDGNYVLHQLYEGDDVVTSDFLPCVSFKISDIFTEIHS